MRCTEVHNNLTMWLKKEIAPDEAEFIEEHLSHCARCAKESDHTRGVLGLLQEVD